MRTILKSRDFAELMIVRDFPDNFSVKSGVRETVYDSFVRDFKGQVTEWMFDGICIQHRNTQHTRPLEIEVEHDFPFFKMQFELKGFSDYERKNKGSFDVMIGNGCHRLFFFPEVKGRLCYRTGLRYTLEILLTVDFVNRLLQGDLGALGEFGRSLHKGQPVVMGNKSLPILPAMRALVYDIIYCPYQGLLKKVFLQAKVSELLLQQLDQFHKVSGTEEKSILRTGDKEKLYYVQKLIEQNLQEPCSLLELAQKAGLNDFKLKKGFKEIFGNTVFGYMTDVRMEKARAMLTEGVFSISDVSFSVGYKNPQHFTAAFKRKFGYLPSALKK